MATEEAGFHSYRLFVHLTQEMGFIGLWRRI